MPLTAEQRKNLKGRFVDGVKNAFNGDPGNTIGGQPVEDFIAGPQPSGPLGQFQWESGRRICRRWAAGRTPNILPGRDIYYRQLCEPYIETAFGPLGDGSAAPPFPGGQCSALYLVYATSDGVDLNIGGQTPLQIMGPLPVPVFSTTLIGFPFPDSTRYQWVFASDPSKVLQFTSRATFTPNPGFRVAGLVSGAPDNCGNLPDEWSPGTGPSIPPESGPIPSPPGWPIPDFDIDISIDPDGTINIDFGDGEPDITFDPDPTEPPVFPPEPAPGDQGTAGSGGEAGAEDAEGEAPPGSVLVGVRLQLTESPPNAKRFAPSVFRGAAYIYMGGDVGLDQDFAGSMLVEDQFIFADKDNLTRWKVVANSGFRWFVTPYYREVES